MKITTVEIQTSNKEIFFLAKFMRTGGIALLNGEQELMNVFPISNQADRYDAAKKIAKLCNDEYSDAYYDVVNFLSRPS
jgi:hypothetical protein